MQLWILPLLFTIYQNMFVIFDDTGSLSCTGNYPHQLNRLLSCWSQSVWILNLFSVVCPFVLAGRAYQAGQQISGLYYQPYLWLSGSQAWPRRPKPEVCWQIDRSSADSCCFCSVSQKNNIRNPQNGSINVNSANFKTCFICVLSNFRR